MSPTAPTFAALYGQLRDAHRRIRELEAEVATAASPKVWDYEPIALQRWESEGGALNADAMRNRFSLAV